MGFELKAFQQTFLGDLKNSAKQQLKPDFRPSFDGQKNYRQKQKVKKSRMWDHEQHSFGPPGCKRSRRSAFESEST